MGFRSKQSGGKNPIKQTSDPAGKSVTDGAYGLLLKAWGVVYGTDGSRRIVPTGVDFEAADTIQCAGGHAVTRITVGATRLGDRVKIRFINGVPCEKIAKRSVRKGENLVAGLSMLKVEKVAVVQTSNLEQSLRHIAEIFTKTVLERIHQLEATDKPKVSRRQMRALAIT